MVKLASIKSYIIEIKAKEKVESAKREIGSIAFHQPYPYEDLVQDIRSLIAFTM